VRVFSVRTATPEDAAAVANVHVRSWQAGYRGLLPDEYLDGLRLEDRMTHYNFGATDPSLPTTMVAVADGVICGFVTTGPSRDDGPLSGEVHALYVDPSAWGRGVGRLLVAEARTYLGLLGFDAAVLWVLVGNHRAERFYRLDGWLPDGRRRTDKVWGLIVEETCYRRRLP
jgi:ribosomal protein S18 acetylase RimI-like enzyme